MKEKWRAPARIAAWTTVGVLGLGVAAGAANAVSSRSEPSTSTTSQAAATATPPPQARAFGRHPWRMGAERRVVHGELVVRTANGYRTVDVQRGEVTAVSPTSITVRSPDGYTATYVVTSGTKVRKDRKPATINDVKTGDRVGIVADKSGSTLTARRIADPGPRPPGPPAPPRQGA